MLIASDKYDSLASAHTPRSHGNLPDLQKLKGHNSTTNLSAHILSYRGLSESYNRPIRRRMTSSTIIAYDAARVSHHASKKVTLFFLSSDAKKLNPMTIMLIGPQLADSHICSRVSQICQKACMVGDTPLVVHPG